MEMPDEMRECAKVMSASLNEQSERAPSTFGDPFLRTTLARFIRTPRCGVISGALKIRTGLRADLVRERFRYC
jgi:hypothetical protein